ncbi:MAG: methionine adenosyltransferase [Bacteroidales bacterium]|nr:methionine adenosyltransferase [Bacteroidales bacterium]MCF8344076.1 methionine adenosyltransferase [Bacteroidales bacterium]MCF8349736.1 methionine adenosyltransferase [Bacteroidales bacterium]MCF8376663.1 methionine adenosyltransferase [Bacteroidales bacterium]MCF8402043.1 methionine adenosyltransferase [Bacteroidales bacterium]
MGYLFTSESVSEGHPDKIADRISDALLDELLKQDQDSKVACETMVTTGLTICCGELKTKGYVDVQKVARGVIKNIGYTNAEYRFDYNSCGVISTIHEQSPDISQGVERRKKSQQGAGDQGMMFGYACTEMDNYMPMPIELAHIFLQELAAIRKEKNQMLYLRPDSKSQVTIEYDDNGKPKKIDTIVVSTQHDEFDTEEKMLERITDDIRKILIPRVKQNVPERVKELFNSNDYKLLVNPTGKFVIGGPHGDTGLTGRKIIVDTYGGRGAHGGGAFSGKDSSKVDRSAAYAARHIAKNMVAAGIAEEMLVQLAYAIGVAEPVGIYVNTNGTCKVTDAKGKIIPDWKIAEKIEKLYVLRPYGIIKNLGLKDPIFERTANYGHFGRDVKSEEVEVFYKSKDTFTRKVNGEEKIYKNIKFFAWEELNYVSRIRKEFKLD